MCTCIHVYIIYNVQCKFNSHGLSNVHNIKFCSVIPLWYMCRCSCICSRGGSRIFGRGGKTEPGCL